MKRIITLKTRDLEESKNHEDVENAKHHANQHVKHHVE